ncbi:TPA: hypothetical protein ACVO1K_003092 [Vibrio diabolicus]|uniref:hypothetical protein n=1 Tax=Vibrio sp. D3 TaxID=3374281 RepID=UPI0037573E69
MMIGHSKQVLHVFFQGQNKITPHSQWREKISISQGQLESGCAIKYLIGYPEGSQPSFYILCDSEELMEHTKDWLNCSLTRYYCQYVRPYKKAEYDFEEGLFEYWPHGFLKVTMWSVEALGIDSSMYRTFLPQAMKESETAIKNMIARYQVSPAINRESSKPVGMLVKSFIDAYNNEDHQSMLENYDLIASSEDIERRNKDALKFMLLEIEGKWDDIINFAHQRNVSSQVVSSGVTVAIMHALVSLSSSDSDLSGSFEIDWPNLHEQATEFLPLLIKAPVLNSEYQWKLWAVLSHVLKIENALEIAKPNVNREWLEQLIQQDTSISAVAFKVEEPIDLIDKKYTEESILQVLNVAQTCHENELIPIYEWVESAPLSLKMKLKQENMYQRLWAKLEANALEQYKLGNID